jgi:uncharacterized protein (TIGR02001 family)
MLTSVRGLLAASLLAAGLAATPAFAQDSELSVSGNAAIVTQYRFRGVGFSDGDIAVQGGVDVGHSSGFYIGTWGSSLEEGDGTGYGHTELDVYGGWSGEIASGVSADVGVLYYIYPNASALAGDTDYVEFYGSLGYTLGPVDTTVGVAYAPDQDSLGSQDNFYVYGDASVGIPGTPLTLNGHVGYTDGVLAVTDDGTSWDWLVGADFALTENLSIGASYVGVEGRGTNNFDDDAIVGTLSVSF